MLIMFFACAACSIARNIESVTNPIASAPNIDSIEASSNRGIYFPPDLAPEPGEDDFLRNCAAELGSNCGEEVFNVVFLEVNAPYVSHSCCKTLVTVGKKCHDGLVELLLPFEENKKKRILQRSAQVWNLCVSFVAPSPALSA